MVIIDSQAIVKTIVSRALNVVLHCSKAHIVTLLCIAEKRILEILRPNHFMDIDNLTTVTHVNLAPGPQVKYIILDLVPLYEGNTAKKPIAHASFLS